MNFLKSQSERSGWDFFVLNKGKGHLVRSNTIGIGDQ